MVVLALGGTEIPSSLILCGAVQTGNAVRRSQHTRRSERRACPSWRTARNKAIFIYDSGASPHRWRGCVVREVPGRLTLFLNAFLGILWLSVVVVHDAQLSLDALKPSLDVLCPVRYLRVLKTPITSLCIVLGFKAVSFLLPLQRA